MVFLSHKLTVCVCACLHAQARMCVRTCSFVRGVQSCVCVCVCVCVFVCVCVCVCVSKGDKFRKSLCLLGAVCEQRHTDRFVTGVRVVTKGCAPAKLGLVLFFMYRLMSYSLCRPARGREAAAARS